VKLVALHGDGLVERKKVGGAAVVWWLAGVAPGSGVLDDDRSAVEERDAETVLAELDAFVREGDAPEPPLPSAADVRDDYHARRHRENLARLAGGDDNKSDEPVPVEGDELHAGGLARASQLAGHVARGRHRVGDRRQCVEHALGRHRLGEPPVLAAFALSHALPDDTGRRKPIGPSQMGSASR
jgi:hypothetical protein